MHPFYSVLVSRPDLVADHLAGYAALMQEEASSAGSGLARRAIAWGIAVLGLIVFLMLAGVAVMLGALRGEFHWALVLAPGTALLVSLLGWLAARRQTPVKAFAQVKAQIDADALALHAIGTRP